MFNVTLPKIEPKRLAVKLSSVGERSVRNGHPWIFSDSIVKIPLHGQSGDICIIFSHTKNKPIGVGLYDPRSPIQIKMLHSGGGTNVDSDFFSEKIERAYALRTELLDSNTNSYRLVFGENDGFPGCIIDIYAKVLVVKLYSAIWFPYLKDILEKCIAMLGVGTVVLRLSRMLQTSGSHGLSDGKVLYGSLPEEEIDFLEHGVRFSANVIKGHKTGFFLDHRHNRTQVARFAKGKTVLDVFSYAGGFSVHALVQGAVEVTSLDISEQALEVARQNVNRNSFTGTHRTIAGDAFTVLAQLAVEKKRFDVVVIDPPSFAKRKEEIPTAKKKYAQLALLGSQLTASKGMLVLASCSSRVSEEEFFEINQTTLDKTGRPYKLLKTTNHDIDHPVTFAEGAYLKCGYYQFLS
ncbi:class I SAM-dependent rRNA methyltransferase [Altibacter sp.]|uniref:class I SAM-dependent rRNA methyltransferase n=1 Tax=Altibacter sp. TaxID=2024823 RepID=UPI00258A3296|nr:class I SAM-dependent rRNA methyltransferase [Altibacter sp.]MCW9038725.1 class I SAM-dependent rRNA methyltransferase [Altibacter sp.]